MSPRSRVRPAPRPTRPSGPQNAAAVVVFGEVLCDLFAERAGQSIADAERLCPQPGGAPANVAVQLARLGVDVSLVSAVGADPFGTMLRRQLQEEGVDTRALLVLPTRRTGATLVEVDADGERRFFGFREKSADLAFDVDDVDTPVVSSLVRDAVVVHTGTVSLSSTSARRATAALLRQARAAGALISLDVNLRPGMYPSTAMLLRQAVVALRRADIVKATRDEALDLIAAMEGKRRRASTSTRALASRLLSEGPQLVMITDEAHATVVATKKAEAFVTPPRLRSSQIVDATGAGDAFMGAALCTILSLLDDGPIRKQQLASLPASALERLAVAGNAAGGAALASLGATRSMLRQLPLSSPRRERAA